VERVVIPETVDQCWFCKDWFYQKVLKEIEVAEEHYGGKTVRKQICTGCHSKIEGRSEMTHPSNLTSEG
jgi:hypothetical protein